ncbi:MAG: Do family serine endopeptidase [Bdellovibrionales bacterium]|nr:Do family serine endopeptidase [Bdellovibrionales bacterium]
MKWMLSLLLLVSLNSFAQLPDVKKGEPLPSNIFVELNKVVNPAVVNINTSQAPRQQMRPNDPNSLFFEYFFGPGFQMPQKPQQSLGTGFIIREDGLILTNNHVIDLADVIQVQIKENGEQYPAKVIGKDKRTDIALIKIEVDKKLPTIKLGNSDHLEVGEFVAAFGNPFGHGHTLTKGVVSAKGRNIDELNKFSFIQTDASINPGNSGGPLVNLQGQVVGVNTAIDGRAQGIGFAIPINEVKKIIPQLEKFGFIKRGYLGVGLQELNPQIVQALKLKDTKGAFVAHVYPDSPAEEAGLKPYDVITEFNGEKIEGYNDLISAVEDTSVGDKVKIEFLRKGKKKNSKAVIKQHPKNQTVAQAPTKSYSGQKAPFDLGFKISEWSPKLSKEFNLPRLQRKKPVITEIDPGSPGAKAGLAPGDIILDVNQQAVSTPKDVLRLLKRGQPNLLRLLKGEQVILIQLTIK